MTPVLRRCTGELKEFQAIFKIVLSGEAKPTYYCREHIWAPDLADAERQAEKKRTDHHLHETLTVKVEDWN